MILSSLLRGFLLALSRLRGGRRLLGDRHGPGRGRAIAVANPVSCGRLLLLWAHLGARGRMLVDASSLDHPSLAFLLRLSGAIVIPSKRGPRPVLRALRRAARVLEKGGAICLSIAERYQHREKGFPFARAIERLARRSSAALHPVYIDEGHSLCFGEPLPADSPFSRLAQAVQELGPQAWALRKRWTRPLHHGFIRRSRRRPWALSFADSSGKEVSRFKALVGSIALGRALREEWRGQERVAFLLPPSVGTALASFAASMAGRTSVHLNYTLSRSAMESAVRQAGLRTVVTSRLFLKKANLELPEGVRPIWLEDLAASIGRGDRLLAMLYAIAAPCRAIERACGAERRIEPDDPVTVIFSSGSTGDPKGVVLSHFNVGSNVRGVAESLELTRDDRILGVLPCFHAFGYMVLWAVASEGLGMAFHPNPLDGDGVGKLVQKYGVTIAVATPTFLQIYLRRCTREQFASLRLVVAGAEKLPQRLARAFAEAFDVEVVEGYGTSECSPVVAVGQPERRLPGTFLPATPRGSVGRPLPGVAVRVVDLETGEVLPPRSPGMLWVKGPNVMGGYLGRRDLTAEVLREGWYVTGDVANVDEDGYLQLTDRLTRFSKIGGEMVPHVRIEEALLEASGSDERAFVVTAVPHERKGEELVVLHTLDAGRIGEVVERLGASDLPRLFMPRADRFVAVRELPLLGSGKVDLRRAREIARESLSVSSTPSPGT